MSLSERVRNMVRNWLRIEPAQEQSVTIRETVGYAASCMRSRVWYRGDAGEIEQLFRALDTRGAGDTARFWASAPCSGEVRKAHSGLPAILVDTLAYLVKSDLNEVEFSGAAAEADAGDPAPSSGVCSANAAFPQEGAQGAAGPKQEDPAGVWKRIAEDCRWADVVGEAVCNTLIVGDGAFKISIDEDVSPYPLLEFWPGDRVEYLRRHGRVTGVVFKTRYPAGNAEVELREIYEPGSIHYELWRDGAQIPLSALPELAGYRPVTYDEKFPLAAPLCVFPSQKYPGRGRGILEGKTDAFDAHDEVISQWIDAVRHGRVKNYIPEDMIPRDPATGALKRVDSFGTNFIQVASSHAEGAAGAQHIETIQPEIKYDAFVESYAATLNLCLQGIVSPATLGIDVGKMSSAEAQREKKDVTGMTRGAITDALEKTLPQVVRSMLTAYDLMQGRAAGQYEPRVTFGEYGAPDFGSRVQTVAQAAAAGVMSAEAVVDELWGASKDAAWKAAEVKRILAERGVEQAEEPWLDADMGNQV